MLLEYLPVGRMVGGPCSSGRPGRLSRPWPLCCCCHCLGCSLSPIKSDKLPITHLRNNATRFLFYYSILSLKLCFQMETTRRPMFIHLCRQAGQYIKIFANLFWNFAKLVDYFFLIFGKLQENVSRTK